MIKSIIKKEWLKLRFILLVLFFISGATLLYFWYDLNFSFSTIEPETMMWYKFAKFEQKPYEQLPYLFYLISFSLTVFQFVPEKIKNRIKIMTHLPISMKSSLFLHLGFGIFFKLLLSIFIAISMFFIIYNYYPIDIAYIYLKDVSFYLLGSMIIYLGVCSVIIEKNTITSIFKLLIVLLIVFIFHKNRFSNVDALWIFIGIVMAFVVLDSFYSIKEQRYENKLFKISIFFCLTLISLFSYKLYINKYKHEFNKYYIFYSPIEKNFVYQKNFGEHQFEYGIKDNKNSFDMNRYKALLPFVYWRDLDIQKRLPIKIDKESFDKQTIKNSRLSFSYKPSFLKKQEVEIYPFINPISKLGIISFPKEMISVKKRRIDVLNFDEKVDEKLTKQLNGLLIKNNVEFPIKNIWGKATNMKPYDLGYFILDKNEMLFRLNRYDNKIYLEKIDYPKDLKLKFIQISENKKRELAGFAIDSKSFVYLIDYKTFEFKKLELENFDYKTMRFLFISNPMYYQIRYTNEHNYHAAVFDKKLNKIDEAVFK